MTTAKAEQAIEKLGAKEIEGGEYAYYDTGMRQWYVVEESDLEHYVDCLEHADEQIRSDAYSHWCAGTSAREATADEVAQLEA